MKNNKTLMKIILFINLICVMYIFNCSNSYAEDLPKIVMHSYTIEEGNFELGDTTKVKLMFRNAGTMTAKNIVITYESENNYIHSTFGRPNQIFIPKLAPGKFYSTSIELEVDKIESTEYIQNIPIYFTAKCYSVATGSHDENNFAIYAPINSFNLEQEISIPTNARKGSNTFISTNLENVGYKDVYDVKVILIGNVEKNVEKDIKLGAREKELIGKNSFAIFPIGDIGTGNTRYKESTFVFSEAGTQNLRVIYTYKDKEGNAYVNEGTEQSVNVVKKSASENETNVVTENSVSTLNMLLIVAIAVCSIAIILVIVLKKHKTKK